MTRLKETLDRIEAFEKEVGVEAPPAPIEAPVVMTMYEGIVVGALLSAMMNHKRRWQVRFETDPRSAEAEARMVRDGFVTKDGSWCVATEKGKQFLRDKGWVGTLQAAPEAPKQSFYNTKKKRL